MSASRSAVAAARSHRSHRLHLRRPPAGQQPARPPAATWLVLLVPRANAAEPLPEPELIYAAESFHEARDCAVTCLDAVLAGSLGRIRIEQAVDLDAAGRAGKGTVSA